MSEVLSRFGMPPVLAGLVMLAVVVVALVLAWNWLLRLFGVVVVPEGRLAMVNKKFVLVGSHRYLPDGAIIALNGEAGWQADALPPGLYTGYWPWQYEIVMAAFTEIEEGKIGIIEATDGRPLPSGRVLARKVECDSFQNARAFLAGGGERGPQMTVIPPGTYRINTKLFAVGDANATDIKDGSVGIIVTREGNPLGKGEIAGRVIDGHRQFQDPQAFIDGGGTKGLQEQVLLAGRYYLNPDFVAVEMSELTRVPIAHVGVVISYVGDDGKDVSGDSFKHGNLVNRGDKGVWADPIDPGMYPINPKTHKVELVPTANVVLNWATGKNESHNLDKNLSTITVRSSDGFTFNLDVSQIIHVPRVSAPRVIARFGSMASLVTQVLEPTIGNYFRNTAQDFDVIDFLKHRKQRQDESKACITKVLQEYDVQGVDTLIGDIAPPPELMKTLTDRKLAEQEKRTFELQTLAQETRKALQQAKAVADTQASVVDAERRVSIEEFGAQAAVKRAEGEAAAKRLQADADAHVTRANGDAEAARTLAVGNAEADVIKQKILSVESGNYAAIEIARHLKDSRVALVPEIVSGGGGDGASVLMALLARNLLQENGAGKPVLDVTDGKPPTRGGGVRP